MSFIKYEVEVYDSGYVEWRLNGEKHRVEGPAVIYPNGTTEWYRHGLLHRVDGPAVESLHGTKSWWINGKRHREDGPAIEGWEGPTWYLDGKSLTEEEYRKQGSPCNGKIVEIDGKKYELKETQ